MDCSTIWVYFYRTVPGLCFHGRTYRSTTVRLHCNLLYNALWFILLLMIVLYNANTEHATKTLKRGLLNTHNKIVVRLSPRSTFSFI